MLQSFGGAKKHLHIFVSLSLKIKENISFAVCVLGTIEIKIISCALFKIFPSINPNLYIINKIDHSSRSLYIYSSLRILFLEPNHYL
jgi:hypothetical protein